jgi:hypothetical protein
MLECERCGREGGATSFVIDPADGVVCKATKACEDRCKKPPDPLLQMLELILVGIQVADIVTHSDEFVEEVQRYSAGLQTTFDTLLGQDGDAATT